MIDVSVVARDIASYAVEDARRELRAHGVAHGLLSMHAPRHEVANDRVLTAADGLLLPVATLNPVQCLEWPAELERVQTAGVVAVRFFPDLQGWSVRSEAFPPIARRVRVPMLLPVATFGDASAIGSATDGQSPVVLVGAHYSQLGDCLAALERWPHLYVETSSLAHFRAIETVGAAVGADRVLFGSGVPARPIQAALNVVRSARISEDQQRAILGGNAARVFGLPAPRFELPRMTDASGLVDVHGHFGALGLPTPPIGPAEQVAEAARHGIVRTVASSLTAIAENGCRGNEEALAAATDCLRPYVVVDPRDPEGSCRAMDEAYRGDRAVGAKLHCTYAQSPTASRASVTLLHEVAKRGRPLLVHVEGPDWGGALLEVARQYPRWSVIVAHAGPGSPTRDAATVVEGTRNVYVELATSMPDLPIVREVVRRVGPRRLLFGTDAPLLDAAYALGLYADAGADFAATTTAANELFGW